MSGPTRREAEKRLRDRGVSRPGDVPNETPAEALAKRYAHVTDILVCEVCGTHFASAPAASFHKNLIYYARGQGCDVAMLERFLTNLRRRYDAGNDVLALERHAFTIEELAAGYEAKA